MTPQEWVPVVSAAALGAWLAVLVRIRGVLRHSELWPDAIAEASMVAILAACAGATLASLGFNGMIGGDASAALAIAWRASVLACGIYAFIGSATDGRAD